MQSRTAIILSMGMLLEKVDGDAFIITLLGKAQKENDKFKFTKEIRDQAFSLAAAFNKGVIIPAHFKCQLLLLLGIKSMEDSEFWLEWNKINTVGKLSEQIKLLQDAGHEHNALPYLVSDTNSVHLEKIAQETAEQKIIETNKYPMTCGSFPLYLSYKEGKDRADLIKHVVDVIQKQQTKPDRIIIVIGDPKNAKNADQQAQFQKECEAITTWGKENGVAVELHGKVLKETLAKVFPPKNVAVDTPQAGFRKS